MGRPKKDGTPAKARNSKACSVLVPATGAEARMVADATAPREPGDLVLYRRIDAPGGLKQAKEIIAGMSGDLEGVEIIIKSKRPERTTKVKFV